MDTGTAFDKKRGAPERPWKMDARDLDEAECAVFGSAMLEPDRTLGVMARWGVRPEWFRLPTGRLLCEVLYGLHESGRAIDAVTVGDECDRRGHPEAYAVLERSVDKTPTAAHAAYYVQILARRWTECAVREVAAGLTERIDAPDAEPDKVLSWGVDRLVRLVSASRAGAERTSQDIRAGLVDAWAKAAREGKPMGVPWPFKAMDELSGGLFPGVNVLAARPSVGKSMFEGLVVRNFLMRGLRVARACLDMSPENLLGRDLCAAAGESLSKMRGGFMTASDEGKLRLVEEASRTWRDTVIEERTSDGIVARARGLWANGGLDLLTVDYAQLLDVTASSRDTDNVRIGKAVARLKEFSLQTGVPVLVLSQLSREVEKENRRPQLSDLRDSGSLEQEASTVAFLYVEPKVGKAWCDRDGAGDWKELPVRPVVWNLMKNQQGATGAVGLRENARYFVFETARRWKAGEAYSATENMAGGYDYGRPGDPESDGLGEYVVCRHPKGAWEAFQTPWFRAVNAAAGRLGQEPYREERRAVGVEEAMRALEAARASTRREDHLADLDAMADAAADLEAENSKQENQ